MNSKIIYNRSVTIHDYLELLQDAVNFEKEIQRRRLAYLKQLQMQAINYDELAALERKNPEQFNKAISKITQQNADDVQEMNEKAGKDLFRPPTEEETKKFHEFMSDYRKDNPRATDREVKRACQRHFGIKVFKKYPDKKKGQMPACDAPQSEWDEYFKDNPLIPGCSASNKANTDTLNQKQ